MKQLCLLIFAIVILGGCTAIEPGSCYRNPAGGTGDTDPMPIAGVGASATGDYATDPSDLGDGVGGGFGAPPREPQDVPPNPCDADQAFGKPATAYIDCRKRGLSADACAEVCDSAGAFCAARASHPYKTGVGLGQLTWCKNGEPTHTCTYTFPNGDGCTNIYSPIKDYWLCVYAGGG